MKVINLVNHEISRQMTTNNFYLRGNQKLGSLLLMSLSLSLSDSGLSHRRSIIAGFITGVRRDGLCVR